MDLSKQSIAGLVGFIAAVIAIWTFVAGPYFDKQSKRRLFDETYRSIQGNANVQSSTNYMISEISNFLRPTTDPSFWETVSYSWEKHSSRLEENYEPLAEGFRSETMLPGETAPNMCRQLQAELSGHFHILNFARSVRGISLSTSGSSGFLGTFGGVAVVPAIPNMTLLAVEACKLSLQDLENPPDERTDRQRLTDELNGVRSDLEEVRRMASIDHDVAVDTAAEDFIGAYSGALRRMGVQQGEALSEANKALREFWNGDTSNFMVPNMNDYMAAINEALRNRRRDFSGEIEMLSELEEKILNDLSELN